MPVVTAVDVRLEDWPLSIVPGEAEIVGATRAGLTVTLTALEVTVFGIESFTCSSKYHVPVVLNVPDEIEAGEVQDDALPRSL